MSAGWAQEIEGVRRSFDDELKQLQSPQDLLRLREKYVGRKKGLVSALMTRLRELPAADRPAAGKLVNDLRVQVEALLAEAESRVATVRRGPDVTLPESPCFSGRLHLLNEIRRQIEEIFLHMGYQIAHGPQIETEENNFSLLNIPEHHPTRDEHDTFFLAGEPRRILRTHTSPVQVRFMLTHRPPIQIISPGMTFRKDDPDPTHSPVFHQVEGLLVDRGITFSHLKGTLEVFIRALFGNDVGIRFRPGFFPFTEPSAEVDMSCFQCAGSDSACRVCKGKGWIEILGSGMVHPKVLANCGIDPDLFSGFAFGIGIERVAMIKYGIPDLRLLYENDLRLLNQFG
jgi:phenylalanyl-tRNA synthetase alpha chain